MKFRPCIDLHSGKVKQIIGSSLNDQGAKENYVSSYDAAYYAKLYKEDGLRGGHVIMLGQGNEAEVEKALKAYPKGLQVGGGVNENNASHYIELGASHVIVTSYIFPHGHFDVERLKKIVDQVGKENLVIDLSCRKKAKDYVVAINRWQTLSDFAITKENLDYLSAFCSEFLVHGVDVEGMCNGIEEDLVEKLASWVRIPCTYAGGISSLEDIELIKKLGQEKIDYTVGSSLDLFGGHIKYKELI